MDLWSTYKSLNWTCWIPLLSQAHFICRVIITCLCILIFSSSVPGIKGNIMDHIPLTYPDLPWTTLDYPGPSCPDWTWASLHALHLTSPTPLANNLVSRLFHHPGNHHYKRRNTTLLPPPQSEIPPPTDSVRLIRLSHVARSAWQAYFFYILRTLQLHFSWPSSIWSLLFSISQFIPTYVTLALILFFAQWTQRQAAEVVEHLDSKAKIQRRRPNWSWGDGILTALPPRSLPCVE